MPKLRQNRNDWASLVLLYPLLALAIPLRPRRMTNSTNLSLPSLDDLRALRQKFQNTLQLPGLKPLRWQNQQDTLPTAHIPFLNLISPEDDHIFDGLPFSPHILTQLKQKYQQSLLKIQQLHRQKFSEMCHDLSRLPEASRMRPLDVVINDLRKVYEVTYATRYLPMIRNEIIALHSKHISTSEVKKVPFNVVS